MLESKINPKSIENFVFTPYLGGVSKTAILGGGDANLHHPHISLRKNAIFTIFGKNVHFDDSCLEKSKKVEKSDDVSKI